MSGVKNIASIPENYGYRNAIINGAFDLWQRGTTFTNVANQAYTADRFKVSKSGSVTGTINISQATTSVDVPTVAQANVLFTSSLKVAVGTAQASPNAGDYVLLQQLIEGYNWRNLAQKPMVLSFWVKSTTTGTYGVSLFNATSDRAIVLTYTINAANTWEFKTINIPASPSTPTPSWNYTSGIGIYLEWVLQVGTTGQTTTFNTWVTSTTTTFIGPNTNVNLLSSTSNTWQITGIQLESGTMPTLFEYVPFANLLEMCQRYYEKSNCVGTDPGSTTTNSGLGPRIMRWTTSGNYGGAMNRTYTVRKRLNTQVSATIYSFAAGTPGNVSVYSTIGGAATDSTSFGIALGEASFFVSNSAALTTVGQYMAFNYAISCEL